MYLKIKKKKILLAGTQKHEVVDLQVTQKHHPLLWCTMASCLATLPSALPTLSLQSPFFLFLFDHPTKVTFYSVLNASG